jgi:glutamate dehydrogenase
MKQEIETALIERVVERVQDRVEPDHALQAESFVRLYYRWAPAADLQRSSELDLYGAALAHWNLARERLPGDTKVHVYNPLFEQHGWQSTHTAVDLVTDDMPFLVDSVTMELARLGYGIHFMTHPVMRMRRDADGMLLDVLDAEGERGDGAAAGDGGATILESVLHVEVDRETDPERLRDLGERLRGVIGEVRAVVEDWPQMRERVHESVEELAGTSAPVSAEEIRETQAFLRWLEDAHFTFLGARDYDLVGGGEGAELQAVEGSGLGILRRTDPGNRSGSFAKLSPAARALAQDATLLVLTKANSRATVHRSSYLDYIGVKRFDGEGRVVGERRIIGLYTTRAYRERPEETPVVRGKVQYVLARTGFPPAGHDHKALVEILATYPRDELFQIPAEELFETAMGILALGERQRVRLFLRRDAFGRFLSCLVYIPRDRFNTDARERVAGVLRDALDATHLDWSLLLSESVLARIHYILHVAPGASLELDQAAVEQQIVAVTRSWSDDLRDALIEELGEEHGNELVRRYGDAFPPAYRADWVARSAVADIRRAEDIIAAGSGVGMTLYRPLEAHAGLLRAKLFSSEAPIALSDVLPIFENMGARVVDERPYEVRPRGAAALWIYDFGFRSDSAGELDTGEVREICQEAFIGIWRGRYENDGLNRLTLSCRLTAREVTILRAISKYLRQAGTPFSDQYIVRALTGHAGIGRLLVALFVARFDPRRRDASQAERLVSEIEKAIDAVPSLDEDRILRDHLSVLRAMTRTDYFQPGADGEPKPRLSFKLDPSELAMLPKPRPRFEIFVYSPRTEGVHLRGGKVARGGLRHSDRREDFRTEILGLMKAQMVKNAVIVPVGAKGGFVVKRPPVAAGREALREEVIACYRTFIGGLLDLTDNIVDGKVVPPHAVVRYDDDDPYLVVAADKGTATFSDIANGISASYGFWLGDAFASGGSCGYDHKRMGITARGAWESVKRHFRELGTDIQTSDFTVVGVGDMSGDVFGNGMLLSRHIRLVGAFNHMHIFLDPVPNPDASFAERLRLFEREGSSWSDYDPACISEGGGVFERTAKAIELSPAARVALGVEDETLAPDELIRALLRAPVDLLWNGGIGTYVKAATETHADVGDKANDGVRVNGGELRCRVVGEGGNLGLTQRGRVEYALAGGRVNTDAIDNVAGVNCSDHEVNLKILLDSIVADGDMTTKQRNELLVEMTEDVGAHVIRDSYAQTQALSLAVRQAPPMLDQHARLMRSFEQHGVLDREIEYLPGEKQLEERKAAGVGLTSPELAVLLAYTKIMLFDALLDRTLPEDPFWSRELERYFPPPLPERYHDQIAAHRLRREIVATRVTNDLVDRAGITFAFRLAEETGASPARIACAFTIASEVFGAREVWAQVEALDNRVEAQTQMAMLLEARKLVERASRWLLHNHRALDVAPTIEHYAGGAAQLSAALPGVLERSDRESLEEMAARLQQAGVPADLALRVAGMSALFSALDIVAVVTSTGLPFDVVAGGYFRLGERLSLNWLRERILELPRGDRWQTLARSALRDDLLTLQRTLTATVLTASPSGASPEESIESWSVAHARELGRCSGVIADVRASRTVDLTTLSVALREVRNLVEATAAAVGSAAGSNGSAAATAEAAA